MPPRAESSIAVECTALRNAVVQVALSSILSRAHRDVVERVFALDSMLESLLSTSSSSFYRGVLESVILHYWPGHQKPPLHPLLHSAMSACGLAVLLARRVGEGEPWIGLDQPGEGVLGGDEGPESLPGLSGRGWRKEYSMRVMRILRSYRPLEAGGRGEGDYSRYTPPASIYIAGAVINRALPGHALLVYALSREALSQERGSLHGREALLLRVPSMSLARSYVPRELRGDVYLGRAYPVALVRHAYAGAEIRGGEPPEALPLDHHALSFLLRMIDPRGKPSGRLARWYLYIVPEEALEPALAPGGLGEGPVGY